MFKVSPPSVSRHLLTRRTVFSRARSELCSRTRCLVEHSPHSECILWWPSSNHSLCGDCSNTLIQVHRDLLITLYVYETGSRSVIKEKFFEVILWQVTEVIAKWLKQFNEELRNCYCFLRKETITAERIHRSVPGLASTKIPYVRLLWNSVYEFFTLSRRKGVSVVKIAPLRVTLYLKGANGLSSVISIFQPTVRWVKMVKQSHYKPGGSQRVPGS